MCFLANWKKVGPARLLERERDGKETAYFLVCVVMDALYRPQGLFATVSRSPTSSQRLYRPATNFTSLYSTLVKWECPCGRRFLLACRNNVVLDVPRHGRIVRELDVRDAAAFGRGAQLCREAKEFGERDFGRDDSRLPALAHRFNRTSHAQLPQREFPRAQRGHRELCLQSVRRGNANQTCTLDPQE